MKMLALTRFKNCLVSRGVKKSICFAIDFFMNSKPIYDLILRTTGLPTLEAVAASLRNPVVPVYEPAREVTASFELTGSGEVILGEAALGNPKFHPRKPFNHLPYNLNDISITALTVRHVKNHSTTDRLQVCRAFNPITNQKETEEVNRMFAAMGAPQGCVLDVGPNFDGAQSAVLIRENPMCIYLHDPFVRTAMHTDPSNLMNGIIPVSPEICAEAGLPKSGVLFDANGLSVDVPADFYYLVPGKHLLAWQLDIGDFMRRREGFHAIEITAKSEADKYAEIVYFIVSNQTFDRLRAQCIENFLTNKVDRRSLPTVGVRIVGKGTVTVSMTYICYPHMTPDMKRQMMPFLPKTFPLYANVVSAKIEAARIRMEEEKDKKAFLEAQEKLNQQMISVKSTSEAKSI